MSTNYITGDPIKTKPASEAFRSGWENIQWGKPLTHCMAEEDTGYCHDSRCPHICPEDECPYAKD